MIWCILSSFYIIFIWNTCKGKLEGDAQEVRDTHIIDTHDDIDYKAFIFDNDSCPKGCQCMANLADCGETSKLNYCSFYYVIIQLRYDKIKFLKQASNIIS